MSKIHWFQNCPHFEDGDKTAIEGLVDCGTCLDQIFYKELYGRLPLIEDAKCSDDTHDYYVALLDYVYCPYCGTLLLRNSSE